jgi:hypothetical protein
MMTQGKRQTKADKAVKSIVDDLRNRRGLKSEWDQIDLDVRKEIEAKWAGLITSAMDKKAEEGVTNDADGSV